MADRQWRIVVEYVGDDDQPAQVIADVLAPTAQSALRLLVLTSTENGRVQSINVQLLDARRAPAGTPAAARQP